MRASTSSCAGRAGTLASPRARLPFLLTNCKNYRQIVDKKATKSVQTERSNTYLTPPQLGKHLVI